MFFYISFLRPPPLQNPPSSPVRITPQITNDLRTEPFDGSQDIYFSWSPTNSTQTSTKPTKLTTWRQENAYKEIMVPPPPGVQEGQKWMLILSSMVDANTSSRHLWVDLERKESIGRHPFSVISMPITFTKLAGRNAGKQEQIERVYRFSRRKPSGEEGGELVKTEATMRITEQTSFDLDKKIWDSGIGLSSWLTDLASRIDVHGENLTDRLCQILFSFSPRKMIELGAGTGIVSLVLSALRHGLLSSISESEQERDCIITTDLPSAMPLLEHNISRNQHLYPDPKPRANVLDWDEDLPEYTRMLSGDLDVIIMADVTYNTSSFPALIRTLSSLVSLNPKEKPPTILLGYKERDSAERTLWDMARETGIQFTQVDSVPGTGDVPIEIWIGEVDTKHTNGE
ncbi:hypothetical protein AAF712_006908 [Marasmius tenuissimus]|uniref:Methyltransferase-domain-containing protein n=1 Tax=Marasmius tenuissimus TaxID=585030 RepID=A0ABR2ZWK6_9AGAR